jgi:TolB-like protein
MRVLAAMGDRANAIRVAEGHVRRFRGEFDLEPDREVLATMERIRRGELPAVPGAVVPAPPAPPVIPPSKGVEPLPQPPPVALPAAVKRIPRWAPWVAAAAALAGGGAFAAGHLPGRRTEARAPRSSIAVLPFRNLSEDTSYAYVGRGLHDELLTQLVKVASLRVIGRASVGGYAETSKPLGQIGEELAVGSIVEAGVQVDGNRLRVTVQLLDPATQAHLWAERYDRTLDDAFSVQSDIAQRIVAALGATLTSAEGGAIAAPPTQVAGAYEYYLQGLTGGPASCSRTSASQQLYERALALDSGFALAHAALASVHVSMHKLRTTSPPAGLAHLAAAGVLYHRGGRYREALDQVKLGLRGAPSDPELWAWMGVVQLSLGSWDSAVAAFEHARGLDPRNANTSQFIGDTYHYLLSPPLSGGHRGLSPYVGLRTRSGSAASLAGVELFPMAGSAGHAPQCPP